MKLDISLLRYLGGDEFRMLHAVEQGMRNHELVPTQLLAQIAGLRRGGAHKVLKELVRHKLLGYNNRKGEGYRLTTSGYDFLALRAMGARDSICSVGNQIGVGKESDIYIVANGEGTQLALKLHRLGRSSFRSIKKNRDYHGSRNHTSWLYLAHLAAKKEYAYMQVLHKHGFPVPYPVDMNRNCIVMELLDATPMCIVKEAERPDQIFNDLMELIVRLANYGLVHCDFNEFNLLVSRDEGKVTLIDFPQMVSTEHPNAEFYFDRDVECIRVFFLRRFGFEPKRVPKFKDVVREKDLDVEVAASGFARDQQEELEAFQQALAQEDPGTEGGTGTSSDEGTSDDEEENADATPYMTLTMPEGAAGAPDIDDALPVDDFGNSIVTAPGPDDRGLQPLCFAANANNSDTAEDTGTKQEELAAEHPLDVHSTSDGNADVAAVTAVTAVVGGLSLDDTVNTSIFPVGESATDVAVAAVTGNEVTVAANVASERAPEAVVAGDGDEEPAAADDALADLATGNRELRAFRDYVHEENGEGGVVLKQPSQRPQANPNLDPDVIRSKVRKALGQKSKQRTGKKDGKTHVARTVKKAKKGKNAAKMDMAW
eukprot:m.183187 g.183187  ORF g.183187 m.183187 type:complete len:599 (+) comp18476_c0_seq1:194-1990(+)